MSYNPDVLEGDLNSTRVKPRIYSLLLKMGRDSVIHMGIYETLDEAYDGAIGEIYVEKPLQGAVESHLPIEMWTAINISDLPSNFLPAGRSVLASPEKPDNASLTVAEQVAMIKDAKNALMKKIVESGEEADITQASSVLTKTEKKFLLDKIKE